MFLLLLIILQPIVFNLLNLNQSKIFSVIGHLMFILIGILLIYIHAQFNKNN